MSQNESIFALVAIPAALAGGLLAWMFRRLDRMRKPKSTPSTVVFVSESGLWEFDGVETRQLSGVLKMEQDLAARYCASCGGPIYTVEGSVLHVCCFDQPWREVKR